MNRVARAGRPAREPREARRAAFERCWPSSETLAGFEFARLFEADDEVFVTYNATRADGSRFRKAEIPRFEGDGIRRVEVYFGGDLD